MNVKKIIYLFLFFFLLLFATIQNSAAQIPTKQILVIFKTSEGFSEDNNPFRNFIAQALPDQDFQIDYFDIESSLPGNESLENYDGVISWFTTSVMKNPEAYLDWLTGQIFCRRKVIILGNMGAFTADGTIMLADSRLNRFFLPFGLEYKGQWTGNPELLEVSASDNQVVGKDISVQEKFLNNYFKFESLNPDNVSYFVVNRKDIPDGESHFIVKTPLGGLALQNYVTEYVDGVQKYFLDVAKFVQLCLAQPILPENLPQKNILALLKTSEDSSEYASLIHRFAFKHLLELGYWTTYKYVEDGLPAADIMESFDAVLTWFKTPEMLNGDIYPDWLLDQITKGRKIIILENFGSFKGVKNITLPDSSTQLTDWWISQSKLNNFFYPFGLEFLGNWSGDPELLQIKSKISSMVEMDIPLTNSDLVHYYTWKSVHPDNKIFLDVERNDQPNSNSAFVVRTPYGGMVFEGYIMKWDDKENRLNFRINLADFFRECLTFESEILPKPIPIKTHQEIIKQKSQPNIEQEPGIEDIAPKTADNSKEIKRWILALYDGIRLPNLEQNPIRNRVEIILNHLGLVLEYWDIQNGLPDSDKMSKFRGVLSWFHNPIMKNPEIYSNWLQQQISADRKVVILGDYGAFYDQKNELLSQSVKPVFEKMGLRYWDTQVLPSNKQKITYKSPEMMDFEVDVNLKEMFPFGTKITSNDPRNKIFLTIEDSRIGKIDAVVVTPAGGIAIGESAFKLGKKDKAWMDNLRAVINGKGSVEDAEYEPIGFWRLDPFYFFTEAFDLKNIPIPDVTTINGLRIFYSHIDGDGLTGVSLIDLKSYASEFVRDQILKQFPLPFTASVITKEIEDKGLGYYNRGYQVARSIFALENVEAATHSYSHPYDWRLGDMDAKAVQGKWEFEVKDIDYNMEVLASVGFIEENLLPDNKKLEILLWSGRCNPDDRALRRVEEMGIKNMNGGDPIYDSRFPSFSTLAPLATNINNYWQYHTSASNDFIYTRGWTKNFDHMAKLIDHFEHTGSPRRILPINIYIHFYIGDRQLGLDGLKIAYNYCMDTQIAPLFTSEYVGILQDFINLKQYRLPDDGYKIIHDGSLRTLRFDNSEIYPDLNKSRGVIGFFRSPNSTYIHLSEEKEQTIYLQSSKPEEVYLSYGSHYINNWSGSKNRVIFTSFGTGKAEFQIANLAPSASYLLSIESMINNSPIIKNEMVRSDEKGYLQFKTTFEKYQDNYSIKIIAGDS